MEDILVLVEAGTAPDSPALQHGAELARRNGARLHLLGLPAARPRRSDAPTPAAAVAAALDAIDTEGVDVRRFEVTSGRPYRAARSYAVAEDVDLAITCCEGPPSSRRQSELRELRGRERVPVLSLS